MPKVNLTKIKALRGKLRAYSPELLAWKKQAAQKWRQYHFDRFRKFASGGGNWKTTQRVKSGKSRFILRETHTLMNALRPKFSRRPGQYQMVRGYNVEVGISGGDHPKFRGSVGQLAAIHDQGKGSMPKRQIIVRLPKRVTDEMVKDLDKAIKHGL